MAAKDFTTILLVDQSLAEVFTAINNVKAWWTNSLEGRSQKLNDEFTVQFGDVHRSTQKLIELIPDKKVVWLITGSKLNFIQDETEWNGTKISFELSEKDNKTEIRFTHHGLTPSLECFNDCSYAWGHYISGSLHNYITSGTKNLH